MLLQGKNIYKQGAESESGVHFDLLEKTFGMAHVP